MPLTQMPRIDIDYQCVIVGWRVELFGRLGQRPRFFSLVRGRPWVLSGYTSLGEPVGGHSIDSVDIRPISKIYW